ncbi:hypothetical protein LshimejAT787_1204220 [Lyophyllum shimeji]|uniref:Uncharacterized protein n=1 Tax=Lyophyllum shimeji TaxID=47721 RepID=A0A9P3PVW1_LYOSH|nr:hypothetical protein LshimejAT787_1204220 [Lyophyllum shimeji]
MSQPAAAASGSAQHHPPQQRAKHDHNRQSASYAPAASSAFLSEVDTWLVAVQRGIRELEDRHQRHLSGDAQDAKIAEAVGGGRAPAPTSPAKGQGQPVPVIPPKSPHRRR